MSSRRSRFKVAASIPVRRKVGGAESKDGPLNQVEPAQRLDVVLKEESTSARHDSPAETSTCTDGDSVPTSSKLSDKESKPVFRRIHPPIQLPVKKEVGRTIGHGATDIIPVENSDSHVSVGPCVTERPIDSVVESRSALSAENEELGTPGISEVAKLPVTPQPSSVPVPSSPAKSPARPRFVRPAVVDAGIRRHSVHASSASESEDETRRNQISRTRKVSENCPVVKNATVSPLAPVPSSGDFGASECARLALLPKRKRPKISNFVRKVAEARRDFNKKFAREKPDRSNLKMFDLIFYNPQSAGMGGSSPKARRKPEEKTTTVQDEMSQLVDEENEDDPDKVGDLPAEADEEPEVAMPAPRVKIGANGEIILDEKSLMIETTEARRGREALLNSVPVFESGNRKISYYGKKQARFKDWSPIETKCFYKALNSIGTDFAMMQSLFPDRTRGELKNKFKREERVNAALIDAAISRPTEFNLHLLKVEIDRERELVEQETKRKMDEKIRKEQERRQQRQQQAAQKIEHSDDACWAGLKQLIGHRVDESKPVSQARRSRRGPSRRKLCADYVDPFEVDERCFEEASKSREITGHRGKENDVEQERRQQKKQQAAQKTERSDDVCGTDLKQLIGHQVDESKPMSPEMRSRRGPGQKPCADYVDDEGNNSDDITGHRGKENGIELPPPKHKRLTKKKQPAFSMTDDVGETGESSDNITTEERSLKRPKESKKVVKSKKRKKQKCNSITVYYPDERGGSDCESVASSINIPERTEEIGDAEFVELIKQNMQNLETATIRVQAPSPSFGAQRKIHVVLDVPASPFSPPEPKLALPVQPTADRLISRTFKVESHIKTNRVESKQTSDTMKDAMPTKEDFSKSERVSSRVYQVHPPETLEERPAIKCENSEDSEINPRLVEEMETETVFTFPSPVQRTSLSENIKTPTAYEGKGLDICPGVRITQRDRSELLAFQMEQPVDYRKSVMEMQEPVDYRKSPLQERELVEIKSSVPVQEQDARKLVGAVEEDEHLGGQTCTEQEQENCDLFDAPVAPVEGVSKESDSRMNYRMTGGLQYALIEEGTDPEQKRTYLAGLRPGTFVFMSTESAHMPLERRCSMFMIAEKISPSGEKQFTPMPVVLPPELMKLITQELNCR